jgi:hypothetical protein
MSDSFLPLNPFEIKAVAEKHIQDSCAANWILPDVAEINGTAFDDLLSDYEGLCADSEHGARLRFLVGNTGAGKSHLSLRLQRRFKEKIHFAFVSNLSDNPNTIASQIVSKALASLHMRAQGPEGVLPYSQIHSLLYDALAELPDIDAFIPQVPSGKWHERMLNALKINPELVEQIVRLARASQPSGWQILKVFLQMLDPALEMEALSWLQGKDYLDDTDLQRLGVNAPLDGEDVFHVFRFLCEVSGPSRPIILILDQLDTVTSKESLQVIERIMFDFIDNGVNCYWIISLLPEKFALWKSHLSPAIWSRIGRHNPRTGLSEPPATLLSPLFDLPEIRKLIEVRLQTKALNDLRKKENKPPLYPFTAEKIDLLAGRCKGLYARTVLSEASNAYALLCKASSAESPSKNRAAASSDGLTSETHPQTLPLDKLVSETLDKLVSQAEGADGASSPDAVERDARVRDIISLWLPDTQFSQGPCHAMRRFRGTDTIISHPSAPPLRVICYDGCTRSLLTILQNLVTQSCEHLLLLRDARIKPPGRTTQTAQCLADFQKKGGSYQQIHAQTRCALAAMGSFLASVREDDFRDWNCSPAPDWEQLTHSLKQHAVWRNPLAAHLGERLGQAHVGSAPISPAPETPSASRPAPVSPQSQEHLPAVPDRIEEAKTILRRVGYAALDRLAALVKTDQQSIVEAARQGLFGPRVEIFPKQQTIPEGTIILAVWNQEDETLP